MIKINPRTKEAYTLFHKGMLALSRAERAGIRIDLEYVEKQRSELTKTIEELEKKFKNSKFYRHWEHSMGRVNLNSNPQLAHFLYNVKKLKPPYLTESGQGATDEEALKQLGIPELEDLIRIRKLKKVRDTYLEAFIKEQEGGYLHPIFNLHLVRTFRSSSDSPNFQNIPKRDKESMQIIRRALYPRPGHQLVEVDFSSLEVRIATCYHKDPTMIQYIRNKEIDMHTDMACQIFLLDRKLFNGHSSQYNVLRQAAKNGFVFPEFYGDYYANCAEYLACTWGKLPKGKWTVGMGIPLDTQSFTLSDHLISKGINSFDKFVEHVKAVEEHFWKDRFPDYAAWKERWWKTYQKYGYIDMPTGFRCSGLMGKNDCINYPIQGSAFHCLLWSFVEIDRISRESKWDSRLIGQIHDSMLLDVHPDELEMVRKTLHQVMCRDLRKAWPWIIVPMEIDIQVSPVDGSWVMKE